MIHQFPLDDQFVCFDNHSKRLNVANLVGARILDMHTSGLRTEDICSALHDEFDASREQIEQDVHGFVQRWESGAISEFKPAQNHEPDTGYRPHRSLQNKASITVHLPAAAVRIHSESQQVVEALRHLFVLTTHIVQSQETLLLEIFEENNRYPMVFNGATLDIANSVEAAAVACLRLMNIVISHAQSHAFTLHAAAVAFNQQGILLPARGGSGKTTLTAYLLKQGYQLINDDAVQLSEEPVHLVPIPLPLSVKAGSLRLVASLFPQLMNQTAYGAKDFELRYLPPGDDQVCVKPVSCKLVCFPRYRENASTQVAPLDRSEALSMLIESGCFIPGTIEPQQVQTLVNWAQGVQFYAMEYASLQEAERKLHSLLNL